MRVLLDTNIWTYLVDQKALTWLHRSARKHGVTVLISPAVVYEQLRHHDYARRAELVEATTRLTWSRMMPEAWTSCEEFIRAVGQHQPRWVRTNPSRQMLEARRSNERDWRAGRGGFWDRARSEPGLQARWNEEAAAAPWKEFEDRTRARSSALRSTGLTPDTVDLDDSYVRDVEVAFEAETPTLRLPAWAFDASEHFRVQWLVSQHATYSDWLDASIDPSRITPTAWSDFWGAVQPHEMPTNWLAWAGSIVGLVGRVNSGTPVDLQLITYLWGADVFATADRRLSRVVDVVAQFAPFQMATPMRVNPQTCVEELGLLFETAR